MCLAGSFTEAEISDLPRFCVVKMKNSTCLPKLGAFCALRASTAPAEKVAADVGPLIPRIS